MDKKTTIFIDLDWTSDMEWWKLTPIFKNTLEELQNKWYIIVYTTWRIADRLRYALNWFNPNYAITENGWRIYQVAEDSYNQIYLKSFEWLDLQSLNLSDKKWYYTTWKGIQTNLEESMSTYQWMKESWVSVMGANLEDLEKNLAHISQITVKTKSYLLEVLAEYIVYKNDSWYDICVSSKWIAAKRLIDHLEFTEDIFCIGNEENDIPLFSLPNISWIMVWDNLKLKAYVEQMNQSKIAIVSDTKELLSMLRDMIQ